MRNAEYDRYGPWVLEISDIDPIPSVFVDHVDEGRTADFQIKIPCGLERRVLRPGMHMYDYLVSLYDQEIVVLERHGNDVTKVRIAYDDVVAIRNTEDLLNGQLHLYSEQGDYVIPYSTVSVELVETILEIIRTRYVDNPENNLLADAVEAEYQPNEEMGFYFTAFLKKAAVEKPERRILAAQAETKVKDLDHSVWRRMFYGAIDKTLLESVHFCEGAELIIVGRGRNWGYRWQANYCKETLYLPLDKLQSSNTEELQNSKGIEAWDFYTRASEHEYVLRIDNPDRKRYIAALDLLHLAPQSE